MMGRQLVLMVVLGASAGPVPAQSPPADTGRAGPRLSALSAAFPTDTSAAAYSDTGETGPRSVKSSDAYDTRLTIHRYASYTELPLFAAECVLGQKVMNGPRTGRFASVGWA